MEEIRVKTNELNPLEREILEEMVRRNPGTAFDVICDGCHRHKDAYSFWYYTTPSLVDLSPLIRLKPLKFLYVTNNPALSDLSPLGFCPHLEELTVYETAVADLTPLTGHPSLKKITLSSTKVTDVSPLATIPTLEMIWLYGTPVTDVSCLAALPALNDLNLYKTQVADLSAFQGRENILGIERRKLGIRKAGKSSKEIQTAIKEIRQKLDRLGITPRPPLKQEDIQAFQDKAGVKLPREYAAFLTQIGDGFEVSFQRFVYRFLSLSKLQYDQKCIKKRFSHQECWIWETDDTATNKKIDAATRNGQIKLVDCGCGRSFRLIVCGKSKGEVWDMTDVGIAPCGNGLDFLDWIKNFLDEKGMG